MSTLTRHRAVWLAVRASVPDHDQAVAAYRRALRNDVSTDRTCLECGRSFDLLTPEDNEEWHYGHDCEVGA